jgi:PHS family inorganic phosphate transporter-like MFS transporter
MLAVVYWDGSIPVNQEVLINLSVLVGTFFGQILVGILADRYGRKRMYGIELLVLTVATVLMSICSKGVLASTNRLGWLVAWRFVMGLGIGGDYPLSAVITAEYVVLFLNSFLGFCNLLMSGCQELQA